MQFVLYLPSKANKFTQLNETTLFNIVVGAGGGCFHRRQQRQGGTKGTKGGNFAGVE